MLANLYSLSWQALRYRSLVLVTIVVTTLLAALFAGIPSVLAEGSGGGDVCVGC